MRVVFDMMKPAKILLLSAFLCCCCSADDVLTLFKADNPVDVASLLTDSDYFMIEEYKYVAGKFAKEKILLKNSKVVLEYPIRHDAYIPRSIRERVTLKKEKNGSFFEDVNKMELIAHDDIAVCCHEINIYAQGKLITSFKTNGTQFYDRRNKLMYSTEEDLLQKYWGIWPENHCK